MTDLKEPKLAPTSAEAAATAPDLRTRALGILARIPGPLIGLVVIVIVLSILSKYFLTISNLLNVVGQVASVGVMSVGVVLVIIIGGIDLSVGAVVAFTSITVGWLYKSVGIPFELALVTGLVLGAFCGLVNGLLITFGRMQPFIATLATMSAATGLALYVTGGNPVNGFPAWFAEFATTAVGGIPLQGFVLILTFLIAAFFLRNRPFGRALYAIGGNEEVARLSGIPVRRIKIIVYVTSGLLAAVAGQLISSRLNSAQPTAGTADLLSVIAVVVIGGASLAGGVGSMLGTFVGLLIIGVLNNGLSLLNVDPTLQPVVLGAVIVAAVMTDRKRRT